MIESLVRQKLTDRGTRYQLYRDLLEMWELGLEIVSNLRIKTTADVKKEVELRAGVALLRKQMDVMAGFDDGMYFLRREINALPVAREFVDGEGEG